MKFKDRITLILSYILIILGVIILLPIIVPASFIVLTYQILYTPFGYYKFKTSLYQKDFPTKYKWLDGVHQDNGVYTFIKENHLPIQYLKCYEKYDLSGLFLYKDTLLDFSEPFLYDDESMVWCVVPGDDESNEDDTAETETADHSDDYEILTVDGWKESQIMEFKKNFPDQICGNIVFFYNRKRILRWYGEEALNKLKDLDGFILYEKGELEKAIQEYVASN